MINHEYKCIFIHIPRTAGTSVELTIDNKNWATNIKEKHLIASVAKYVYRDYWDEYFKFTIIRNPWDRVVSMTKFPTYYMCQVKSGMVNLNGYLKKYPSVEVDPRAVNHPNQTNVYSPDAVYLNILDEPIDYIARFETLQTDWKYIQDKIKCSAPLKYFKRNKLRRRKHYRHYYSDHTRQQVYSRYLKDIEYFGYKF